MSIAPSRSATASTTERRGMNPIWRRELRVRALVVARELRRRRLLEADGRPDELRGPGHEHRQLADLVVRVKDVVDLALHDVLGRLVGGDHRVGHVAHVHQRAPHPAAAVEQEPVLDEGVLHEGVDHQVEAHPRAVAVDRAVAEDHRAEALVLKRRAAPARRSASRWSRRRAAPPGRSRRACRAAARRTASRRRRRPRAPRRARRRPCRGPRWPRRSSASWPRGRTRRSGRSRARPGGSRRPRRRGRSPGCPGRRPPPARCGPARAPAASRPSRGGRGPARGSRAPAGARSGSPRCSRLRRSPGRFRRGAARGTGRCCGLRVRGDDSWRRSPRLSYRRSSRCAAHARLRPAWLRGSRALPLSW